MKTMIKLAVWLFVGFVAAWGSSQITDFNGGTPWRAQIISVGTLPGDMVATQDEGIGNNGALAAMPDTPVEVPELTLSQRQLGRSVDFGAIGFVFMIYMAGTFAGMVLRGSKKAVLDAQP